MNDPLREKSMPVFVFVSMCFHALLFLYAPQLIAGLVPTFESGHQGGLTYVTLVDINTPEPARAVVDGDARTPQSQSQPASTPDPAPRVEDVSEVHSNATPTPEREPVEQRPQPTSPPEPTVNVRAETPPEPAPNPEPVVRETPTTDTLVVDRGERIIPSATVVPVVVAETPELTKRAESVPAPTAQMTPSPEAIERPAVSGSDSGSSQPEDTLSRAPDAQQSNEPVLPPTGESMTEMQGGLIYPKQAVDFLRQSVTVRVETIVNEAGEVIEVIIAESSGIEPIDNHAAALASRGITYSPHDSMYKLDVYVTYNHDDRSLSYRVGEFIQSVPTTAAGAQAM